MKKGDFLVINSRVVHSVQCPRQCKEMLLQIPYPMMKRFIPQIDGLEFVCERISGKKHQMDTSQVEQSLSTPGRSSSVSVTGRDPGVLQPDLSFIGFAGERLQRIRHF